MKCKKIVIMSSIPAEINILQELMQKEDFGGKEILICSSGIGKIHATSKTQKMIHSLEPDIVIFVGFAGALDPALGFGDLGVISAGIDAEMDARAFNPCLLLGQIPFSLERIWRTDSRLVMLAMEAPVDVKRFNGYVATTSVFMDAKKKKRFSEEILGQLEAEIDSQKRLPNIIDMESAGFLEAANTNKVPCLILRTITNTTEGDSASDYSKFLFEPMERTFAVIKHILENAEKVY